MATLSLKQETVEAFAASATQKAAMVQRRVSQRKNEAIASVPLLQQMKEKVASFDQKMTEQFGKNYTKTRNILTGIGKFYIAGQIGGPALVALGAINTAKALKPMLKEAEKQRQEGKVTGLIDFMKKNPKESAKTMLSASLGGAVITCCLECAANGKFAARAGVAAMVFVGEMRTVKETTKQWVRGQATFKDVARDITTVGISMGAFIAGTGWGHDGTDHNGGADHGTASVSAHSDTTDIGGHSVSVPVSKADKANPLRPQPPKLQQALINKGQSNATAAQSQVCVAKLALQKKEARAK